MRVSNRYRSKGHRLGIVHEVDVSDMDWQSCLASESSSKPSYSWAIYRECEILILLLPAKRLVLDEV